MFAYRKTFVILSAFLLLAVVLSSCNLPQQQAATEEPNLVYTAAAQTVAAALTQSVNSGGQPSATPGVGQPSATPMLATPTNTLPAPTATSVPPTATQVPPTATPVPCNLMEFMTDVNYKDDTQVKPGEIFDKTWRIKNIGSCTWTSSYSLVFDSGDSMGGPASQQLTNGQIPPGSSVDVTVRLTAPSNSGTYQGYWKVRDGYGVTFGYAPNNKAFWVKIKVSNPVNFDFVSMADDAEWRNGTSPITYGDPGGDTPGVAAVVDDMKLENNKTYQDVLATYPEIKTDGVITGLYDDYTVKDGDRFKAQTGFKASCSGGKVKFQVYYLKGGTLTLLKEWEKSCDGSLTSIDFDLNSIEGQKVNFMLAVTTNGAFDNDHAVWVNPRIQP